MKLRLNTSYLTIVFLLFVVEICIVLFFKTGFIRHTFGDYLAVIFLYTAIRTFTTVSIWRSAIAVLAISFCIEFLQLTPILKLFNLEQNAIAKLVFGTTFHFTDLVAYTLGVLTILSVETKSKTILLKNKFFNPKKS